MEYYLRIDYIEELGTNFVIGAYIKRLVDSALKVWFLLMNMYLLELYWLIVFYTIFQLLQTLDIVHTQENVRCENEEIRKRIIHKKTST